MSGAAGLPGGAAAEPTEHGLHGGAAAEPTEHGLPGGAAAEPTEHGLPGGVIAVLTGPVMHGNHLGTGINIPTANIAVPDVRAAVLKKGVYGSTVEIDGKIYESITNVGCKPTVQDSGIVNAESFIYDYEGGELYGREITVTLLEFRRPEMKFASFEELSAQMHRDLERKSR